MVKVYIDSNVFVSHVLTTEREHEGSKTFINYLLENNFGKDITFHTSRFTEVEVGSAIFRRSKKEEKARATLHKLTRPWSNKIFLFPENPKKNLKTDDFVIKLVETALRYGTNFGDSVHANDVESYKIDYLVTWNLKDFKKLQRKIKTLKIVTPIEMTNILKKMLARLKQ